MTIPELLQTMQECVNRRVSMELDHYNAEKLLNAIEKTRDAVGAISDHKQNERIHDGYQDFGAGMESVWKYVRVPTAAAQIAREALKEWENDRNPNAIFKQA